VAVSAAVLSAAIFIKEAQIKLEMVNKLGNAWSSPPIRRLRLQNGVIIRCCSSSSSSLE